MSTKPYYFVANKTTVVIYMTDYRWVQNDKKESYLPEPERPGIKIKYFILNVHCYGTMKRLVIHSILIIEH